MLLAVSGSACSGAERLTTGMRVRNAVVKLGDQPAATVIASVHGSPRQAREFLTQARRDDDGRRATEGAALRLVRAELTMSAGTPAGADEEEETPLKEMPTSDAANVAAALNFGAKDVIAVKSVDDKLYLRVSLRSLVEQAECSKETRRLVRELVGLADDLPSTLKAAKDALQGEWVRADPEAFDDFARAAETLAERQREKQDQLDKQDKQNLAEKKPKRSEKGEDSDEADRSREILDAVSIGSALKGQPQREFISGVEELLREHAEFDAKGTKDGAELVRMTLPGQKAAKDLVATLRPLGAEIDPRRVPDGDIAAELSIRRGQLTTLTLDLGQLTGGDARLPLRLEFSGGDAVAVTAPGGTEELKPQDLVAAMLYGALGTEKL